MFAKRVQSDSQIEKCCERQSDPERSLLLRFVATGIAFTRREYRM